MLEPTFRINQPVANIKQGFWLRVVSTMLFKCTFNNVDSLLKLVHIYFVKKMV
jgi:hypothetical protein